jgi:hypothetical protein
MSKNTIVVLMYHRQKLLNPIVFLNGQNDAQVRLVAYLALFSLWDIKS